ncbi:MAG: hypothetical protein JST26_16505 [Bacteroidetes bacterium]|nr:hypothetical protein [Bacteroidota bacterium]
MQKQNTLLLFLLAVLVSLSTYAQPYVDPLNFNTQYYQTTYKDSVRGTSQNMIYNLNLFLPKEFKNGNTLIIRAGAENVHSQYSNGSYTYANNLYSLSMPIGMQLVSSNKKWKGLFLALPKINSDFKDDLSRDVQLGGMVLGTYVKNDNLKFKLGLYYSPEFWGNFFVPLVGMDWKINNHWSMYGVMPSNYRIEYRANNKLYMGLGFKSFQRSYRLSKAYNNDFVRLRDSQIKLFVDYFVYKKIMLFADVAYGVPYSLTQYSHGKTLDFQNNPLYAPMHNSMLFTLGFAYRIRLDLKP